MSYTTKCIGSRKRQSGAILVIALVFLIAITLLTTSSMRSSNMGLLMAQNEEARVAADQAAQALADAIVANPVSTPVVGRTGYAFCTDGMAANTATGTDPGVAGETVNTEPYTTEHCDRTDLPVDDPMLADAIAQRHMTARVQRTGNVYRPPPRVVESSMDKFTSASFTVTTTFDRVEDGLGYQQVTEGVLVLVPKD
jgi:hypothetical protein